MLAHPEEVAEQFDDMPQERDAATLGMWTFLVTEFLFFGVLFAAYTITRVSYPQAFAEASQHNDILLGAIETVVLLTSSLTMEMGVSKAQNGRRKSIALYVLLTMALGVTFLVLHSVEYYQHYHAHLMPGINFSYTGTEADHIKLVFFLYFVMTGFHMLHVSIGVIELGVIAWLAWRGSFTSAYYTPLEISGLYWHFVHTVWIFLFPLFYLVSVQ